MTFGEPCNDCDRDCCGLGRCVYCNVPLCFMCAVFPNGITGDPVCHKCKVEKVDKQIESIVKQ